MPINTEMYKGIISRLSPERAKQLAERMDRQSASRGWFALFSMIGLMIFMAVMFLIARR